MKRLSMILVLAFAAAPLFAITGNPVRGNRIGVLRIADRYDGPAATVAENVQSGLCRELRNFGFDAFETDVTYDDLRRFERDAPSYYVEIVRGDGWSREAGGVDLSNGVVGGSVGVIVSGVAAEVRLYDGRSLEVIRSFDLRHRSTSVAPTGVGIGGRWSWLWVGLPFFRYGEYRNAAREVAHDAAKQIAGVTQR